MSDRLVLAFLIQPVLLFGRPGRRTVSHRVPPLSVWWPITGSTVRPSVIGRLRSTQIRAAERLSGLDIAVWPRTNTANSWVRATVGVPPADAGSPVQDPATMASATAKTNRGARVRTPVAVLMTPAIPSR